MFPFRIRGERSFPYPPEKDIGVFLEQLRVVLQKARAKDLGRRENEITFRGGLFRLVTGLNPLACISQGYVIARREGDRMPVRYEICFRELIILALTLSTVFSAVFYSKSESLLSAVVIWVVLIAGLGGFNLLFGWAEFRRLLWKAWKAST